MNSRFVGLPRLFNLWPIQLDDAVKMDVFDRFFDAQTGVLGTKFTHVSTQPLFLTRNCWNVAPSLPHCSSQLKLPHHSTASDIARRGVSITRTAQNGEIVRFKRS